MHIVYAVTTCSDGVYRKLFESVKVKPAFQAQKYHRLLIEGLAAHVSVDVVANPPGNRSVLSKAIQVLGSETEGGAFYHHIAAIRNPILKLIWVFFSVFFSTLRYIRRDSVVIVDVLNRTAALSALMAARLRGKRCVGIVTDLPDMLGGSPFSKKIANFVTRHCTDYVLLTQAMNDYVNRDGKPYVILEGHADVSMEEHIPSLERKVHPRICLYAGGVRREYGLDLLVEGFRKANLPDAVLEIYGPGEYVGELEQIAAQDDRIRYGGMKMNAEIVQRELEATLLVNPRPIHEAFVKYSFPSKTMEYMASGTPVLTTRLPGMPEEYYPYVYFIEEITVDGIADALSRVLTQGEDALFAKGAEARSFVLTQRNNRIQAKKIIAMLEERN